MNIALPLLATAALFASDPEPQRPWTLLIYGAADNNADGPILDFLDDIRSALDNDPGMELLLFLDRSEGFSNDADSLGADFHGARIYRLRSDTAELLDASEFFPGMVEGEDYEVDSADPENISSFIAFGKKNYPARNYGLMIYSHADGCTMCPDEESGRSMSIPELTDRIDEEMSVDFLALELCNMAGVEIAYQWRPGNGGFSADVLVAIPNAGPPLDWDRAFERIRSEGHASSSIAPLLDPAKMTAADFGTLVVQEGFEGRKVMLARHPEIAEMLGHEAAGCYDLRKAGAAKKAIDALAMALAENDNKAAFEDLRDSPTEGTVMNYVRGRFGERPYVDLHALLTRATASEALGAKVREAASIAQKATDELVISSFGMPGLEGFEDGKNGIFIAFPDGDAKLEGPFGRSRMWRKMAWYTPLDPDSDDDPYGRWAFLGDGAEPGNGKVESWFELMDCWFDDVSTGPAGLNRYSW